MTTNPSPLGAAFCSDIFEVDACDPDPSRFLDCVRGESATLITSAPAGFRRYELNVDATNVAEVRPTVISALQALQSARDSGDLLEFRIVIGADILPTEPTLANPGVSHA